MISRIGALSSAGSMCALILTKSKKCVFNTKRMMKYTRLLSNSLPFALCACMAFGFTACSDDAVEPSKDTTEDTVVTDLEWTNDALIEYVMSQFAELDENGNLVERTTYFRQIDESDTTAIFTCAPTLAEARQKFLTLVPPSLQQKIVVANDSAEMSLPIGTSPLALKYKEGSTDGNVVATVQLPSQGAYTKIANTLTMVKSFGENWEGNVDDVLFKIKRFSNIPVLTSSVPIPLNGWFTKEPQIRVSKVSLSMFCYNINEDGEAQYVYLPPHVEGNLQLGNLTNNNYIAGHFFPRALNTPGKIITTSGKDKVLDRLEVIKEALPSRKQLREFIEVFSNFTGVNPQTKVNRLETNFAHWDQGYTFAPKDENDSEEMAEFNKYKELVNEFKTGFKGGNNVVDGLARLSDCFPYYPKDYPKYVNKPTMPFWVEEAVKINWDIPFFRCGNVMQSNKTAAVDKLPIYRNALSFATCELYGRDENGEAHVANYYQSDMGEWEVVEKTKKDHFYQVFFAPAINDDGKLIYVERGRDITAVINSPLRLIYFHKSKLQ